MELKFKRIQTTNKGVCICAVSYTHLDVYKRHELNIIKHIAIANGYECQMF